MTVPQPSETKMLSPLRLGEPAPDFMARSTQGIVSLSDYRGQWLVLFSHPADFTPVCTSELVAIARAADRFAALDCALMGLSVDTLFSHLAWIRAIKERFDVTVDFPVIEDPTLEIARAYGMIAQDAMDAGGVRATYFLDPDGILRASTFYPGTVGRSVDEMLRMVAALRRVQDGAVVATADWQPGCDLLAPPGVDLDKVLSAPSPTDWFYAPVPDGAAHMRDMEKPGRTGGRAGGNKE